MQLSGEHSYGAALQGRCLQMLRTDRGGTLRLSFPVDSRPLHESYIASGTGRQATSGSLAIYCSISIGLPMQAMVAKVPEESLPACTDGSRTLNEKHLGNPARSIGERVSVYTHSAIFCVHSWHVSCCEIIGRGICASKQSLQAQDFFIEYVNLNLFVIRRSPIVQAYRDHRLARFARQVCRHSNRDTQACTRWSRVLLCRLHRCSH